MPTSKRPSRQRCLLPLVALLCVCAANAQAAQFTFKDNFSGPAVKPEWSSTTTAVGINVAPSGERFLGPAVGGSGFSNDAVVLTLSGVPAQGVADVLFDLYIIRSMDGEEPFVFGGNGDLSVSFNAVASFSNAKVPPAAIESNQSYPWPGSPALAGSVSVDTLRYSRINPSVVRDSTYRLHFHVPYAGTTLFLRFKMFDLQSVSDESWGIDNVNISIP